MSDLIYPEGWRRSSEALRRFESLSERDQNRFIGWLAGRNPDAMLDALDELEIFDREQAG
jgi:hypothetical protein